MNTTETEPTMLLRSKRLVPFIWRYRSHASPSSPQFTDPTAGADTPYRTNDDGQERDDTMEDEDETDDESDPQTGLVADSGTKDDEEEFP